MASSQIGTLQKNGPSRLRRGGISHLQKNEEGQEEVEVENTLKKWEKIVEPLSSHRKKSCLLI